MDSLNLGVISNKAKENIAQFQPLISHAASLLGYRDGHVRICESYDELQFLIENGEVALASGSAFSTLMLEQDSKTRIITKRWKHGMAYYNTVFFSKQESDINQLEDLVGKTIVFERETSTSGYFLPMVILLERGFQVQHLSSTNIQPDPDKVGYLFIQDQLKRTDEINMSAWVFRDLVEASAFSNDNWNPPHEMPENIRQHIKIIYQTDDIARNFISTSPLLSQEKQMAIAEILTSLHLSPKGRVILAKLQNSTKFETLSDNDQKVMDKAREQLKKIKALAE